MKNRIQIHAFTLVELMVGMSVLVLMFSFLMVATNQMMRAMNNSSGKVDQYRAAREGFDRMTNRLSQAVLNAYWDVAINPTTKLPDRYERKSDLRFVSGWSQSNTFAGDPILGNSTLYGTAPKPGHCIFFTAPLGYTERPFNSVDNPGGLENLLNVCGYYLEYSQDTDFRPRFIKNEVPSRWRWRLMEYVQPTESFAVYGSTSGGPATAPYSVTYKSTDWITRGTYTNPYYKTDFKRSSRPIADNIVALVFTPRLAREQEMKYMREKGYNKDYSPIAPDYSYNTYPLKKPKTANDSALNPINQLPPVVQVTLVAVDERSAGLLTLGPSDSDLFKLRSRFGDTSRFTEDLQNPTTGLQKALTDKGLQYRVFTTNVHIRAAKWSREQADTPEI